MVRKMSLAKHYSIRSADERAGSRKVAPLEKLTQCHGLVVFESTMYQWYCGRRIVLRRSRCNLLQTVYEPCRNENTELFLIIFCQQLQTSLCGETVVRRQLPCA